MFLDALIEVSARIPDIVCIAQTTLVMVNNALLVNDRGVLFFRFDLVSDRDFKILRQEYEFFKLITIEEILIFMIKK